MQSVFFSFSLGMCFVEIALTPGISGRGKRVALGEVRLHALVRVHLALLLALLHKVHLEACLHSLITRAPPLNFA